MVPCTNAFVVFVERTHAIHWMAFFFFFFFFFPIISFFGRFFGWSAGVTCGHARANRCRRVHKGQHKASHAPCHSKRWVQRQACSYQLVW